MTSLNIQPPSAVVPHRFLGYTPDWLTTGPIAWVMASSPLFGAALVQIPWVAIAGVIVGLIQWRVAVLQNRVKIALAEIDARHEHEKLIRLNAELSLELAKRPSGP